MPPQLAPVKGISLRRIPAIHSGWEYARGANQDYVVEGYVRVESIGWNTNQQVLELRVIGVASLPPDELKHQMTITNFNRLVKSGQLRPVAKRSWHQQDTR